MWRRDTKTFQLWRKKLKNTIFDRFYFNNPKFCLIFFFFFGLVVSLLLLESQATISTSMGSRLIQIDVDFWVSQWTATSIASNYSFLSFNNWLLIDQLNTPVRVHNSGIVHKTCISVVIGGVSLKN